MGLRHSKPLHFSPVGCSDTIESTNVFSGAMAYLQNLIPDPSTINLWQCRPAAVKLIDFTQTGGFTQPAGFISVMKVVGDRVYGLMATGTNPGYDEPFCYDLISNLTVPISGVTPQNVPRSPSPTADWIPPTVDVIGHYVVFTHPGFFGLNNAFFGYIDIGTPSALQWAATNTMGTGLIVPPTAVAQFAGRAWYLVNPPNQQPAAYFTDVLNPLQITRADQILTFGDTTRLTALKGLPLNNQLGGIIQGLMIFKGNANIVQITGDYSLGTLQQNTLNVATGTLSPRSICSTPTGLVFLAPEGIRVIDQDATVGQPIGQDGSGVSLPFVYAFIPSRVCASANADVIRVTVQNAASSLNPYQEWWFDMARKKWHGPHTFPASSIAPYRNTFIMVPQGILASLWQSDAVQNAASVYIENGVQLTFNWRTSFLPDTEQMAQFAMIETTLNLAMSVEVSPVTVSAYNESNFTYDSVTIVPQGSATIWGNFVWGQGLWGGNNNPLFPHQLQWHYPIVFQRLAIGVLGQSAPGITIGDLYMRYEELGYLQQPQNIFGIMSSATITADTVAITADTNLVTADNLT